MTQKHPRPTYARPGLPVPLDRKNGALIIIDMQYLDAHRDYGMVAEARQMGHDVTYYCERLEKVVYPNIGKLLVVFRQKKMKVCYTLYGSEVDDFSDLVPHFRATSRAWGALKGEKGYEIIEELKPQDGDILVE